MNLLYKECKLCMSILTPLFLLFTFLTFVPNYPITLAGFFICFGLFHSFQKAREAGDILFSALLPVPKRDVVRAKFMLVTVTEMLGLLIAGIFTLIRCLFLSGAPVYATQALLPANFVYLSVLLLIFAAFNIVFLGGFFKTAYRLGGPFVGFLVTAFVLIAIGETLPHLPGLGFLSGSLDGMTGVRAAIFCCCFVVYFVLSLISLFVSMERFEKIDL